jgi:hypothetical protein
MRIEEARRRAAALLRLADKAGTPEEAAAAAGKAQEVMARYSLDSGMLDESDPEADPGPMVATGNGGDPVGELGRQTVPAWRWSLAWHLAKANGCAPYKGREHSRGIYRKDPGWTPPKITLHMVGRAADVDTVRYLFPLIARQVDQAAARAARGMGAVYGRSFREGAVERIGERLRAAVEAARASFAEDAAARGVALVKVESALIHARLRHREAMTAARTLAGIHYRSSSVRYGQVDGSARAAGRTCADSMTIGGRAAGALPGGQGRLPV